MPDVNIDKRNAAFTRKTSTVNPKGDKKATQQIVMDTDPEVTFNFGKESVAEKMMAHGVKAVNAAKIYVTATAIDFVVPANATKYPIHQEFVNLLHEMIKIENSLTIKASKGSDTWTEPEKIPSGDDFTKQFSVRTETTKRGTAKIVVHCTLSSKQWLNNINWNSQMMSFLKN
jgi:hypothetical protein